MIASLPLWAVLMAAAPPRVAILPVGSEGDPIAGEVLKAFGDAFRGAAVEVFIWRRWELAESDDETATHTLQVVLFGAGEGCRAKGTLFDRRRNIAEKSRQQVIDVCGGSSLIAHAEDLGRKLAEGPREEPRVTLNLTPLDIPSIDIPNIPEVGEYQSATVARALEVYRSQALLVIDDGDRWFVARSETLLDDCEALQAAQINLTKPAIEHCDGNFWEFAWLGAPVGAIGLWVGASTNDGAPVALAGTVILLGSAAAALLFNRDAADVEDGDHFLTRDQMAEVAEVANERLRRELGLGERDLIAGGIEP